MTETVEKKPRGNPNWKKKEVTEQPETNPEFVEVPIPSDAAWLEIYCSILGTYNVGGQAMTQAAAKTADFALEEFRKRYPL